RHRRRRKSENEQKGNPAGHQRVRHSVDVMAAERDIEQSGVESLAPDRSESLLQGRDGADDEHPASLRIVSIRPAITASSSTTSTRWPTRLRRAVLGVTRPAVSGGFVEEAERNV